MHKMRQRGEIVIANIPKRKGLERVTKGLNSIKKAFERVKGFFPNSALENKKNKSIKTVFFTPKPLPPLPKATAG